MLFQLCIIYFLKRVAVCHINIALGALLGPRTISKVFLRSLYLRYLWHWSLSEWTIPKTSF